MLGNGDGGVLRDVAGHLRCALLDDEAAETAQVYIIIIGQRSLDALHESLDDCLYLHLLNAGALSDFAYDICLGHISYDIKIILGGCYNGARHSDYPMPDKNNEVNYRWKINTHIENIAQQISRKLPNAKIKANRIQVSSGNFNKPIYYKGGIEIDASSFYRIQRVLSFALRLS